MEGEQVHNMIHRTVSQKGFLSAHALPLCTGPRPGEISSAHLLVGPESHKNIQSNKKHKE
jgi:hypothetical protein